MIHGWLLPSAYLFLYAVLHSLLATLKIKHLVSRWLKERMAYYRLAYVILSILLILPILLFPMPDGTLLAISSDVS